MVVIYTNKNNKNYVDFSIFLIKSSYSELFFAVVAAGLSCTYLGKNGKNTDFWGIKAFYRKGFALLAVILTL